MSGLLAVILAAGFGRRIGRPKALLPMPGRGTFLDAVLAASASARPGLTVVVAGPWWAGPAPEGTVLAINPDPDRGQASSLRCAMAAAGIDRSGVLVALVDHPLVRPATFAALADLHEADPDAILIPEFDGRRGHPVVFPEWTFADLGGAEVDREGARVIVRSHPERVRRVPVEDPGIVTDVDTPADFRALG